MAFLAAVAPLNHSSGGPLSVGFNDALYRELWHACAGPLVTLPCEGERVYYFPQGHMEQQSEVTSPDPAPHEAEKCTVHSFCKTLTSSDTSTHAEYSVLRRHADDCLPPPQCPWQELVATDLHGNEWHFQHIF